MVEGLSRKPSGLKPTDQKRNKKPPPNGRGSRYYSSSLKTSRNRSLSRCIRKLIIGEKLFVGSVPQMGHLMVGVLSFCELSLTDFF
jgi:hypothetical protein